MLGRHSFLDRLAVILGQVLKPFAELMILVGVQVGGNNECRRGGIEHLIATVDCVNIVLVVPLETPDEACLGCYFSVVFQMVYDQLH
jgi:hypothetical protein